MINLRKLFFYINDSVKGGVVKKHLQDIGRIVENPASIHSKNEIENRKEHLLNHAIKNVTYYRKHAKMADKLTLSLFPVINKNIIRENINEFVADGMDIGKLFRVVTSGSTGTPFSVYHDANKKLRNNADTIFFGKLAGFEIGTQLNYLKIWNSVNLKSNIKARLENIVPIDVTQLSDPVIKELVSKFTADNTERAFLGYASALESVCRYIEKWVPATKIENVSAIIAMSEGLSDYAKTALHTYFGVHPVSRYSNVENGIIAQQLPDGTPSFVINWASYWIEILEMERDAPVAPGKPGRIVVTDYFNYAMPMIRYDTGDIGVLDWDEASQKVLLSNVEGRKMDLVFNTSGNLVSSFTITNNMWLYPEIKQYQFIQTSKDSYLFKLNLDGGFEREELLISEFKNYFGQDARFSVEYVDEIPLLNSGKRKKVMNISN